MAATHQHGLVRALRCACHPSRVARARHFQRLEAGVPESSRGWKARRRGRAGQAIIESCIVVVIMSLILFGLLEVSRLFMGQEVMNYAATVGARAHAVGFNDFMIYKTFRVATIPVAGRISNPSGNTVQRGQMWTGLEPGQKWDAAVAAQPGSLQYTQIESSRIPLYLAAEDWGQLSPVLDYEEWDDISMSTVDNGPTLVNANVRKDIRLIFPFHRVFWPDDDVRVPGDVTMDSHYQLYLEPGVAP